MLALTSLRLGRLDGTLLPLGRFLGPMAAEHAFPVLGQEHPPFAAPSDHAEPSRTFAPAEKIVTTAPSAAASKMTSP